MVDPLALGMMANDGMGGPVAWLQPQKGGGELQAFD